jgi:protein-S-isoprenylcysteine O-methyltransferase Ste14
MNRPSLRPESATSIWLASANALLLIGVLLILTSATIDPMTVMAVCLLTMAVPIAAVDLYWNRVHRRPSAGLGGSSRQPRPFDFYRVLVKLAGLWFTLALVAVAYWSFPVYRSDLYVPFFELVRLVAPGFLIASVPYFLLVDRRLDDPFDGYWHSGRLVLGIWPERTEDIAKLKEHFLGWTIKAFFLPLMTVFLFGNIRWFGEQGIGRAFSADAFGWWLTLAFFLDVAYACIGYLLTLRVLDTHIRSANPLLLGWVVAIVCYPPFWGLIEGQYLQYAGSENWETWLAGYPVLYALWAAILLVLIFFYSWSTVAFGLRFSNLTHRGIITSGPYALSKHPAYIAKNMFWWFSAMPFLSSYGIAFAIKGCLLLALVNLIYLARARTEERHLSEDPVYVAYADWIREHGLLARLIAAPRRLAGRTA